jgi:hypothetical protein
LRAIERDTLKDYPNADRVHQWDSFIYMLCALLKGSDVAGKDKIDNYFKLIEEWRKGPPASEEKASHLSVRAEMADLRGTTDAGTVYKAVSRTFPLSSLAAEAVAVTLTDALASHLTNLTERPSLRVVVERSGGDLRIRDADRGSALLFFSRFRDVSSLAMLDKLVANPPSPPNPAVQMVISAFPRTEPTDPVSSLAAAGVYRMALIAPGYREVDRFVELTRNGTLLTAPDDGPQIGSGRVEPTAIAEALEITLDRRAPPDALRIAVHPFQLDQPAVADASLVDFDQTFVGRLKDRGFDAFVVPPGMTLRWDPARRKGVAPDNSGFADVQVRIGLKLVRIAGS